MLVTVLVQREIYGLDFKYAFLYTKRLQKNAVIANKIVSIFDLVCETKKNNLISSS